MSSWAYNAIPKVFFFSKVVVENDARTPRQILLSVLCSYTLFLHVRAARYLVRACVSLYVPDHVPARGCGNSSRTIGFLAVVYTSLSVRGKSSS